MDDVEKIDLLNSLTKAMGDWIEKAGNDADLPWLGASAAACMAHAAFAVIVGISDAQDYLADEGMLRGDE